MRWNSGKRSSNYQFVPGFWIPLIIWAAMSVACIVMLDRVFEREAQHSAARQVLSTADEYLRAISSLREKERGYLLTSNPDYLVPYQQELQRVNSIQWELMRLSRGSPEQTERLERASGVLQQWLNDASQPRITARNRLPHDDIANAHLIARQLLLVLSSYVNPDIARVPDALLARLRESTDLLLEAQPAQIDRDALGHAVEQIDRYRAAADAGDVAAARQALHAMTTALVVASQRIIEAGEEVDITVENRNEELLVDQFREIMDAFIAKERDVLAMHRAALERGLRIIRWLVWAGLAVGAILNIIVIYGAARRLRESVDNINRATEELAKGNMSARVFVRGHGAGMADLAARFNLMADLVESRNRQSAVLAELGEMLHSCHTTDEALEVFGQHAERLFPHQPGMLYLISPDRADVAAVSGWADGKTHSREHFTPDDCWALRMGHAYENGTAGTPRCRHVPPDGLESMCLPLAAFGETIGLLFLTLPDETDNGSFPQQQTQKRFYNAVAEQLALALANVKLRENLRNQSIRDPLTQLYNRRNLDDVFSRELHRAERHQRQLAVLTFDIDHFKRFNDAYGHDGGDAVLKCIGETLQDFFRVEDTVFRAGGEEFVALLPDTEREDALRIAEDLRKTISALTVMHNNAELPRVTVSVGASSYPANGANMEALMKAADEALYRAKEAGRNMVVMANGA